MRSQCSLALGAALAAVLAAGCGGNGGAGKNVSCGSGVICRDGAVSLDAGAPDGAALDAGPGGSCTVGSPCQSASECGRGFACLAKAETTASCEVEGNLGGNQSEVELTGFTGGYCVPASSGSTGSMQTCNPDLLPDDPVCGDCASCVDLGADFAVCLRDCNPGADGNSVCRDGYECDLGSAVCVPGCTADAECMGQVEDTNGDGTRSCDMGDRFVVDPQLDNPRCDPESFRCRHDGTPGAEAGQMCSSDAECEADGQCLRESAGPGSFPGGYCTRFGCDVRGRDCAGDGVCFGRRSLTGIALCAAPCTVGAEPREDQFGRRSGGELVPGHGQGCRPGYACNWRGVGNAGDARNGGCLPGNYNTISQRNFASSCDEDSQCWSRFGLGTCMTGGPWAPDGYCSFLDCGAPGLSTADVCGDGAQCVDLDGAGGNLSACLESCDTAADCPAGQGCINWDLRSATGNVCFPGCDRNDNCRPGEQCVGATSTSLGDCMPR